MVCSESVSWRGRCCSASWISKGRVRPSPRRLNGLAASVVVTGCPVRKDRGEAEPASYVQTILTAMGERQRVTGAIPVGCGYCFGNWPARWTNERAADVGPFTLLQQGCLLSSVILWR